MHRSVAIIGAGQAGATLATTLRTTGWEGAIELVDSEGGDLYQRPPLSKDYLSGSVDEDGLITRTRALLERDGIGYRPGATVAAIDRPARRLHLDDGSHVSYDIAVIATGSRPRSLVLDGSDLLDVHLLRTRVDAAALRRSLGKARDVVVLGGGFLGLEIASSAAKSTRVVVVERAAELLQRSLSAPMARELAARHADEGTRILVDTGVRRLVDRDGAVSGVELDDGTILPADVVIVSVGAQPNIEIAAEAGLDVVNGIVVDSSLRTSDPSIYAIGDCVSFPHPHVFGHIRLESVQNAVDQARHLAHVLTGTGETGYAAVPWFWSHQANQNLQIVGIAAPDDDAVVEAHHDGRVVIARTRDERVTAVETLNAPRVHRQARALLAQGQVPVLDWEGLLSQSGVRR
ncbi:FAD-dependent oxidoreductase [uncultured Microbacterium sp.]|uniref:NAD(P)/FAD-dependent oxidoreductase n=1 Tax=uncultured Microbacterium sp. TaxID=191216 RepID=UPI0028D4DCF2|nr:FAD-dependent oxidoreductase [uncultured Microbacterium sp.]